MDPPLDLESQNREQPKLGAEDKDTHQTIGPPGGPGPDSPPYNTVTPSEGDFDDRAAEFWSVYTKEAQRHDGALIGSWKDDMEAVIIFAGLYSATLTAFIVESRKKLMPDPSDEIAYYARQAVTLLAQVSAQLAASGSPVPSTFVIPPAFPDFRVAQSDIRVNIYWFMSLVFSLSAALMATLVQQWVREYVHIFERYSHPLKCARIRQFLQDGAHTWKMDVVVNVVPALIHVSLFLFFLGLADSLFTINIATAVTTTTTIVICALCYLFSVIAPILDAKSPYQSPLSSLFWYISVHVGRRKYKDHVTGNAQPINTNMAEGRVQLAMAADDFGDRKDRDARAIGWILDNLTEDIELEPLVRYIPDSFNSLWGKAVWRAVSEGKHGKRKRYEDPGKENALENGVAAENDGASEKDGVPKKNNTEGVISRLNNRIAHLLRTCTDPGTFSDEAMRERRAHACIGASLSLVLSMKGFKWKWLDESEIPTMAQVLVFLSDIRKSREPLIRDGPILQASFRETQVREAPTAELDSISSIRWTCVSMIVVRKTLQTSQVRDAAKDVIDNLASVTGETEGSDDEKAAKTAVTIDAYLKKSWDSANSLHKELILPVETDELEDRLRKIVQEKKDEITKLDETWNAVGWARNTDEAIVKLAQTLKDATSSVINCLPGAVLQWSQDSRPAPERGTQTTPSYIMPQFIPPRLLIQRLWLCVWAFRSISATGGGASKYSPKSLSDLSAPELSMDTICKLMDKGQAPMETQLWRLHDLHSGGLVYTLELFIHAIKFSSKAALRESSKDIYRDTFDYFTDQQNRNQYQFNDWTERLLVDLLRRVLPAKGDLSSDQIPEYIIDRFLTFLADVLENKEGSHVENAISQIKAYRERPGDMSKVADNVLSRLRTSGT